MWRSEKETSPSIKRESRGLHNHWNFSLCGKFFLCLKNQCSVYLHHSTHYSPLHWTQGPHHSFLLLVQFCFKRLTQRGIQRVCLWLTVQPRLALICVVSQQVLWDHSTTDRLNEWARDFSMPFPISDHELSCKLQRYSQNVAVTDKLAQILRGQCRSDCVIINLLSNREFVKRVGGCWSRASMPCCSCWHSRWQWNPKELAAFALSPLTCWVFVSCTRRQQGIFLKGELDYLHIKQQLTFSVAASNFD